MALSMLNDDNVISGCEGDCQSTFSMLLLNELTGNKSYLANTAYVDMDKNDVILAHCSIPVSMTEKYVIRSHFESRLGVGIQGFIQEGPVTIFKAVSLTDILCHRGSLLPTLRMRICAGLSLRFIWMLMQATS
jgi:L-fucose isomerase-like protein